MSKRLANLIFLIVTLLTLGASYEITNLRFDYEFEHFFPTGDEDLDFYQEYMEKFSTDVDFVLIALHNDQGIFRHDFLERAKALHDDLKSVERVQRIVSPFEAKDYAIGPLGPIAIPYLHVDEPERYARDSTRIYKYQKGVGSLFSSDAMSISLMVLIEEDLSKLETDTVFFSMKEVIDSYEFDQVHLAGKAVGQAYYINQIKREFALFFCLAVLIVTIVLILIYRSVWGTLVPLIVVLLSVIWLLGFMGLMGKSIDLLTTLLPMVLFVVGVSDVIHLLSRYFEEIRNGHNKMRSIAIAYRRVGAATFLTSLTTGMGFLTLLTSGIRPVRELGVYAAVGVFIAFFLAFTLLPAILSVSKVPALAFKEPSTVLWNRLVTWLFRFSLHRGRAILIASTLLVILAVIGAYRVHIDNYLLEDVGEGDPHRKSFEYFEEHFAGVRPFELQVSVLDTNGSLFEMQNIREMERIERYLKEDYGVGFMVSPLNIVRSAHQALHGGRDSAAVIPASEEEFQQTLRLVKRLEKRPEFTALLANNNREGRFTGKIVDVGGAAVKAMNDRMEEHFTQEAPLENVSMIHTGMSMLIDKNNETLSWNMMSGLLIALGVVALIMGLLFRSFRLMLISLVPNVLPLLFIAGFMGWVGIDMKVSTSIIFGIAFGIAVDDSIHFLIKYRQERAYGRSKMFALRRTTVSTGKAIILTTLVLCSGFFALTWSDFTSVYYVGLLVSITLATAVAADLILLPVLLRKFTKL